MICISCGADIPPQFVFSIQSNVCSGCGGPIMDEDAKSLMADLADALARMPNDPQGLAGWLLTNYRLQKVGTGEPTGFHRKSSGPQPHNQTYQQGPQGPQQEGAQYHNSQFGDRSGANKMINSNPNLSYYQGLINSSTSESPQQHIDPEQQIRQNEMEMVKRATEIAKLRGRSTPTTADMILADSETDVISVGDRVEVPLVGDFDVNEAEMAKMLVEDAYKGIDQDPFENSIDPVVQKMRMNRLKNQSFQSSSQKKASRL